MATVKFKGKLEVNLNGTELNVGDIAPVVTGVAADLSDIKLVDKRKSSNYFSCTFFGYRCFLCN